MDKFNKSGCITGKCIVCKKKFVKHAPNSKVCGNACKILHAAAVNKRGHERTKERLKKANNGISPGGKVL